uniref:Uncharacterized protein n=1 Tax=Paramormyrops kingsleyae TaxID=1676925 RepID=A0A3B3S1I5_9TELE
MFGTSGGLRKDLLTPAVRLSPWLTPFPGPRAPMESSASCRGLPTGKPAADRERPFVDKSGNTSTSGNRRRTLHGSTCGHQPELVLFVTHFLLLFPPREEKSHHPLEEVVHELDGERHDVHLKSLKQLGIRSHH